MLIKVSATKSDFLIQKVNGDDGIMVEGILTRHISRCQILMQVESLTEISESSNSDEDEDDTYLPTV
jgi:hypothetical protein